MAVSSLLRNVRHPIAGAGPRLPRPCQSRDPPSFITSVIVQASPYRWKGSHAGALQPEMSAMWGERLCPTTAENLRWRLDAWSPPPCPQAARTTTIQVLDFVRFKSALPLSLSSLILALIYIGEMLMKTFWCVTGRRNAVGTEYCFGRPLRSCMWFLSQEGHHSLLAWAL